MGKLHGKAQFFIGQDGDGNKVHVEVELREGDLSDRHLVYETVEHSKVLNPLTVTVTHDVYEAGRQDPISAGAGTDPIRDVVAFTPGWDQEKATKLAAMADRWHNNTLRAGCAHQRVVWEGDSPHNMRPSLDKAPPCPHTGYRYGRAWLAEVLPPDVEAYFRGLIEQASM